jgi:HEAT repeat protein
VSQLVDRNNLEGLRALGPAALPELARLYETANEDRRIAIANLFYQLGQRSLDAERVLLRDVHTANPALRIGVQYALGRVSDDPKVIDTLVDILQHDASPVFRDKAACALAYDQIHLTEAQKVRLYEGLIDALSNPKGQVQAVSIQALKILTGQDKGFRRSDPPEKKQQSLEAWRRWLAEYRANL